MSSTHVKFTPELFGEFPRRSPATPNSDGTYALYTVSSYSFDAHVETKETKVLNLKTNEHSLFSDDPDVTSAQWLKGNQVMWQKCKDGKTELFIGTVGSASKGTCFLGSIDAPIGDVKTKVLPDDSIVLCFSAPVSPEGNLLNPESMPKPKTTAREFETVLVRYWDQWTKPYSSALFYTTLVKKSGNDRYTISSDPPVNLLKGTRLRFPHVNGPFGEGGSYDVSAKGIVFTCVDPEFNISERQSLEAYLIPISSFTTSDTPEPIKLKVPADYDGSVVSPVFTLDGAKIAFLKCESYLRDYFAPLRLFIVPTDEPAKVTKVFLCSEFDKDQEWDRWPSSLLWSASGDALYFVGEDEARCKMWKVSVAEATSDKTVIKALPSLLVGTGAVASISRLSDSQTDSRIFYSASSLIDSSTLATVDATTGDITILSSLTEHGSLLGIDQSQITEFYCDSKDGAYNIQVWQINPPSFKKDAKYPLALWVHGGPQVASLDQWSNRWSLALYAAQGYVVLVPNYTGSSSFGATFAADVTADWGGRAYDDIVQTFEHAKSNIPHIDTTRAIAMGGSFGGYMMNWIQGQPLGKELKALVCHNGIWSLPTHSYTCDVPHAHADDHGGAYWDNKERWEKYDPSRYVHNWSTPMLVIHSDNDFRCPMDQGIAPYMVCQLRGIPSRLLNFPDENHWVLGRENQLHWYKTILGWINKWTGVEDGVVLAPPLSEPVPTHMR